DRVGDPRMDRRPQPRCRSSSRMKRVLIIAYYWPPNAGVGVYRWLKFTKYLPQSGWQPVIHTPENPEVQAIDRSLEAEVPPEEEGRALADRVLARDRSEKLEGGSCAVAAQQPVHSRCAGLVGEAVGPQVEGVFEGSSGGCDRDHRIAAQPAFDRTSIETSDRS